MNTAQAEQEKTLTTADFAGAAEKTDQRQREADEVAQEQRQEQRVSDVAPQQPSGAEHLAALFDPDVASRFRARWDEVQIGFVDDPRQAVRQADELVAQVMKSLAETFSSERAS